MKRDNESDDEIDSEHFPGIPRSERASRLILITVL